MLRGILGFWERRFCVLGWVVVKFTARFCMGEGCFTNVLFISGSKIGDNYYFGELNWNEGLLELKYF